MSPLSGSRKWTVKRHDDGDVDVTVDDRLSRDDTLALMDELAVAVYGSTKRDPIPGPPPPPPERKSFADEYGDPGSYGGGMS